MELKRALKYLTLPGWSRLALGGGEFPLNEGYTLPHKQWGQGFPGKGSSLWKAGVRKNVMEARNIRLHVVEVVEIETGDLGRPGGMALQIWNLHSR